MRNRPAWMWVAGIVGAAFVLLVAVNVVLILRKPSDEVQIREALEEMRLASVEGRPGGVQQYLSERFELPEEYDAAGNAKALVRDFIRNAKIDVLELREVRIEISGDTAIAHCHLVTDLTYLTRHFPLDIQDFQVEFRREMRRRLLLVPDPTWLVVGVGSVEVDRVQLGI